MQRRAFPISPTTRYLTSCSYQRRAFLVSLSTSSTAHLPYDICPSSQQNSFLPLKCPTSVSVSHTTRDFLLRNTSWACKDKIHSRLLTTRTCCLLCAAVNRLVSATTPPISDISAFRYSFPRGLSSARRARFLTGWVVHLVLVSSTTSQLSSFPFGPQPLIAEGSLLPPNHRSSPVFHCTDRTRYLKQPVSEHILGRLVRASSASHSDIGFSSGKRLCGHQVSDGTWAVDLIWDTIILFLPISLPHLFATQIPCASA